MRVVLLALFGAASSIVGAPHALAIPIEHVLPGQLLISEVMPNPVASGPGQEWFEVHNTLPVPVDLNGMKVSTNTGSFSVTGGGYVISPGGFFLFASSSDATVNGGLPAVGYSWGSALVLTNSNGHLSLSRADATLIAGASWAASTVAKAYQLVGGTAPQFVQSDFMLAITAYGTPVLPPPAGTTNTGTPGAANSTSMTAGGAPLLISEIMANPSGLDSNEEWFEIYNPQAVAVDLNGMTFTSGAGSFTLSGGPFLIQPGAYLVFARTADDSLNGGLPRVDFAWGSAITLANTNGQLSITDSNANLVVKASWSSAPDGRSLELEAGTGPEFTQANYQSSINTYTPATGSPGNGDPVFNLGTPGATNTEPMHVTGIAPFQSPVPAPSTPALLMCGLAVIFFWRKRNAV